MEAKPWLKNENWRDGVVRSSARTGVRFLWFFAIFWNLVALPVCFTLPDELAKGNTAALLVLLFPAVGIGLVFWAWRASREWKHFGVTELHLDPFPGSIGGQVGGTLEIKAGFARTNEKSVLNSEPRFQVTLQSVYSYVSGSGKNRSRKESIKWQVRGTPEVTRNHEGMQLAFCFDVPQGLNPSEDKASSYYFWRLQVVDTNDDTPIRLNRSFILPVYETGEMSRHLSMNTGAARRDAVRNRLHGNAEDLHELKQEHGLALERQGDWLRLYFPPGRLKLLAFAMFLMGLLFGGAGVFLGTEGEFFMSIVFGGFGIGMVLIGIWIPFNALDVRISAREIYVERLWLGVRLYQRSFAPEDIQRLKISQSSSNTSRSGMIIRYKIGAQLRNGRSATLAEGIVGQLAADAVRQLILEQAGLQQKRTR